MAKDKTKSIMLHDLHEAQWIGEDGAMACVSSSARGAFIKFKRLMRQDVGDLEAEEMKIEDVGVGWFYLPTEEEKKQIADGEIEEYEWYVSYKKPNDYQVFVYSNEA